MIQSESSTQVNSKSTYLINTESRPYESFKSYNKSNKGLITNSGEVYDIVNSELDEKNIGCLYLEVLFTRDTALF